MASKPAAGAPQPKCRCCPFGFHIDLDFVGFAEDVSKGNTRKSTDRPPSRARRVGAERNLTSPLESIFSDSLENIMSDFEGVLDEKFNHHDFEPDRNRNNGYLSDYTGYRRGNAANNNPRTNGNNGFATPTRPYNLELSAAKPAHRPPPSSQSRTLDRGWERAERIDSRLADRRRDAQSPAFTALGRTISEIKARNEDRPDSRGSIRLGAGTPTQQPQGIDLGVHRSSYRSELDSHLQNVDRRGSYVQQPPSSTGAGLTFHTQLQYRPAHTPTSEADRSGPSWRRPSTGSSPLDKSPSADAGASGFASLRRGREVALSDSETAQHRVRYYSSSPRLPRRLHAAPPLPPSPAHYSGPSAVSSPLSFSSNGFTHSQGGQGETLLARHVETNTEMPPARPPPPVETRSVGVTTGPIPPSKPCTDCPQLRSQIEQMINEPHILKPSTMTMGTSTEERAAVHIAVGTDTRESMHVGVGTDLKTSEEIETQTLSSSVSHSGSQAKPSCLSIGLNTDELDEILRAFQARAPSEDKEVCTDVPILVDSGVGGSVDWRGEEKECQTAPKYYRAIPSQTENNEMRETASSPIVFPSQVEIPCENQRVFSDAASPRALSESEEESMLLLAGRESRDAACGPDEPGDQIDADTASLFSVGGLSIATTVSQATVIEAALFDQQHAQPCLTCARREQEEKEKEQEEEQREQRREQRAEQLSDEGIDDGLEIPPDYDDSDETDKEVEEVEEKEEQVKRAELVEQRVEKEEKEEKEQEKKGELTKAEVVKKLLTQDTKQNNFVRGTAISKSARFERKKGDDLEYIENKNKKEEHSPSPATTPSSNNAEALKSKVVLKKELPLPSSSLPEPVPARIPRPKISKYAPSEEAAENDDEADEASDRLTPLRSELRSLGRWPRDGRVYGRRQEEEDEEGSSSASSDDEEGSYETNEADATPEGTPFEISPPFQEALQSLHAHLTDGSVQPETADWALKYVQHEWLKTAARKASISSHVALVLESLAALGPATTKTVVNITDQNGNTALHYAVSHANFGVVSVLLDSGECQLNLANKAGYTAVMLAALSALDNDIEKAVVQRLFCMGAVNAKAAQHGQTALMLAVSHGKTATTRLLLECGADVNIQDEEGSTALMCAAEHGHKEIVKMLLANDGIDAALADCDSSTALSIAVENGHRDIGVLIYAHLQLMQDH